MLADVFGVCIRTVPVAEGGLLTDGTFAEDKLAVTEDVGAALCDASGFFGLILGALFFCLNGLRTRRNFHVAVHVYINDAINLRHQVCFHLGNSLFFLFEHAL